MAIFARAIGIYVSLIGRIPNLSMVNLFTTSFTSNPWRHVIHHMNIPIIFNIIIGNIIAIAIKSNILIAGFGLHLS